MTAELGQPGQIIDGKYRIVRLLGTGGMGAVYEGENIKIRRKVAIKMLHGSVSSQDEVVKRFENEAKAAGMVGSDHICEVLDLGELPDQTRYMVMEYLDGETLSNLIKHAGRLLPEQSIPILSQICDALGAAHAAGIIHRDLKPDNIFILPQKGGMQNFVKILDFGVSKFSQLSGEAMNVTRAGAVVGTPYYMSPEQARGTAVDQRTDIYAIGVLLYQATTGQVPYQAETFNELLFKIVLEQAPPPQTYIPDLDPEFSAIIQRAMAREPDQRYASCAQFKDALLQYQARLAGRGSLPAFPGHPSNAGFPAPGHPSNAGFPAPGQSGANFPAAGNPAYVGQSGAAWPVPAADGTIPMQPGLNVSRGSNAGPASPMQSGASWPGGVMGAAPPAGFVPSATTSNSWGNASSPSNALVKPKAGNGAMIAVVAVAAIVGIGGAVAAVMFMGNGTPKPAAGGTPTATATVAPTVAPTAPPAKAAPTTTAEPAKPAPTETAAPATATASAASASAAPVEPPAAPSAKPPGLGKPGGFGKGPIKSGTKSGSKGPGNDLGY